MIRFKHLTNGLLAAIVLSLGMAHTAHAASGTTAATNIISTMSLDLGSFDLCMVKVAASTNINCGTSSELWFHFSCNGAVGNNKEYAKQNYSTALAAYLAGKKVVLYIDDTKKIGNVCFASGIALQN